VAIELTPSDTGDQTVTGQTAYPTITISTTMASAGNYCSISFEYLPESISIGTTAVFTDTPVPFSAVRILTYDHSEIDEISLTVRVVAGCNNAITRLSGGGGSTDPSVPSGLVAAKTYRNDLITVARLLYSITLPAQAAANSQPPPTCQLTIGTVFSGVGAFTGMKITHNGPWDVDGSPTDMDVAFTFKPSNVYNSNNAAGAGVGSGDAGVYSNAPCGANEVSGDNVAPYALTVAGNYQSTTVSNPNSSNTPSTQPSISPELPTTTPPSGIHRGQT
jgi:hypothetical protein